MVAMRPVQAVEIKALKRTVEQQNGLISALTEEKVKLDNAAVCSVLPLVLFITFDSRHEAPV